METAINKTPTSNKAKIQTHCFICDMALNENRPSEICTDCEYPLCLGCLYICDDCRLYVCLECEPEHDCVESSHTEDDWTDEDTDEKD